MVLDDHHRPIKHRARVIPTDSLVAFPQDEEDRRISINWPSLVAGKSGGRNSSSVYEDWQSQHSLVREALLALCAKGQTEAAILNTGLFLDDLPQGRVDQDQLHTILPHPMHLIRVTLQGADVIRLILEMEKIATFAQFPNYGNGFSRFW